MAMVMRSGIFVENNETFLWLGYSSWVPNPRCQQSLVLLLSLALLVNLILGNRKNNFKIMNVRRDTFQTRIISLIRRCLEWIKGDIILCLTILVLKQTSSRQYRLKSVPKYNQLISYNFILQRKLGRSDHCIGYNSVTQICRGNILLKFNHFLAHIYKSHRN